ncbi:MAG: hypothetical protein Q9159_006614 [Coniocarpon cinnabarinum]
MSAQGSGGTISCKSFTSSALLLVLSQNPAFVPEKDSDATQAALVASLFGGSLSWYVAQNASWSVRSLWYAGLVCTIGSISVATQQSISLYRFSATKNGLKHIRSVLGGRENERGVREPGAFQVYVWQVPVMLLRFGIVLFLLGLWVLLWSMASHTNGDLYMM